METVCENKGLSYEYEADASNPEIWYLGDETRIKQILLSLLDNAVKYTEHGSVTLTVHGEDQDGDINVVYSVTDTGTGVPPEDAEKIFERFTKLNEYVQGTGLGLSICRDIACRMGGKVFLDTTHTGKGARFVFTVPLEPVKKEA